MEGFGSVQIIKAKNHTKIIRIQIWFQILNTEKNYIAQMLNQKLTG
jgi:hypothetical protein